MWVNSNELDIFNTILCIKIRKGITIMIVKSIENRLLIKIQKYNTNIVSGVISEEPKPGILILSGENDNYENIIQLQFDKIEDVNIMISKLYDLKKQMEMIDK